MALRWAIRWVRQAQGGTAILLVHMQAGWISLPPASLRVISAPMTLVTLATHHTAAQDMRCLTRSWPPATTVPAMTANLVQGMMLGKAVMVVPVGELSGDSKV